MTAGGDLLTGEVLGDRAFGLGAEEDACACVGLDSVGPDRGIGADPCLRGKPG